ncbi:exported hypothetical protein [Bacillus licheniformis]
MNMLSAGLRLLMFKLLMNRSIMPANTSSKAGGRKASASGKDALSFGSDKTKFYEKVRPSLIIFPFLVPYLVVRTSGRERDEEKNKMARVFTRLCRFIMFISISIQQ